MFKKKIQRPILGKLNTELYPARLAVSDVNADFRPWYARNANWFAPFVVAAGVGVMISSFAVLPWIQSRVAPPRGEGLAPLYNDQAPVMNVQSIEVIRPMSACERLPDGSVAVRMAAGHRITCGQTIPSR